MLKFNTNLPRVNIIYNDIGYFIFDIYLSIPNKIISTIN